VVNIEDNALVHYWFISFGSSSSQPLECQQLQQLQYLIIC